VGAEPGEGGEDGGGDRQVAQEGPGVCETEHVQTR